MKTRLTMMLLALGLALIACVRPAEMPWQRPTATPTPPPTPTFTPPPTATATPQPTATPVPAARVGSGDQALQNGDWEAALKEFELAQAASSDPEIQAAAKLGIGRTRLYQGNHAGAVEALQALAAQYPASPHLAEAYFFLGEAYQALERYAEAAQAYQKYLDLRPGLAEAYLYDRIGDALFAAADYPAAVIAFQQALQSPSTIDSLYLQLKMARAYTLAGDAPSALSLYDDAYLRSSNDNSRALIDLRKGQIYESLGQSAEAQAAYLDAVNNFPKAYESYAALVALVEAGVAVDELQRGIVDYYAGEYGVAMAAFDRYLQNNPVDPATAHYFYGLSAGALGGHEEAIQHWDTVIQEYSDAIYWDEAWEQKAYTQWALLGKNDLARQTLLDFVELASAHPRAAEFLFDAALAAEREQQYTVASELWSRLASTYPDSEYAGRALFLAGINHYRQGSYAEAQLAFQRFQGIAASLEDKAAAMLWTGKTQNALGDLEAAKQTWQAAAEIDPTGYYSERARDLLHERQPFSPPESYDLGYDEQLERQRAEDWIRSGFGLPPETDLSGPGPLLSEAGLLRGVELWRLGLYDEANAEFEQLRLAWQNDPAQSYRLANFLIEIGAYRTGIQAARQVLSLANMSDALTMNAPAYFNYLRFGAYYSELVMPLAEEYALHPLLFYSVMRQESLFEGHVRSSAGARGLMQVIPATGQEIAADIGWPEAYSDEDLYRPLVSLLYGAHYLDKQRDLFDGNLYAALAAYNGGPGNAAAWLEQAPDDPDLFLEVIRFAETRNYLRGVSEIFAIYRMIYDRRRGG
jgi:soluble lytic murein transglycosylase